MATLVNIRPKFFRTIVLGKKWSYSPLASTLPHPHQRIQTKQSATEPSTGSSDNSFLQRNINLYNNPLHFFAMISIYGMCHCLLAFQWQVGKSFCIFVARREIMNIYNWLGLQGICCHLVKLYLNAFMLFFKILLV